MERQKHESLSKSEREKNLTDVEFDKEIKNYLGEELTEQEQLENLNYALSKTIDVETMNGQEKQKLDQDFGSGNFLFHGAKTEQLIKIIESGTIMNSSALSELPTEESFKTNSGYEGVSWSFNKIDALPGSDYHLAGFVAPPEKILGTDQQLVVPSRPAPYEFLQISSEINSKEYYKAKNQYELYRTVEFLNMNSVVGNLVELNMNIDNPDKTETPLLLKFIEKNNDMQQKLHQQYQIENQKIIINPDLVQQNGDQLPVSAVWIQAMIDNDNFKDTEFNNMNLPQLIKYLDSKDKVNKLMRMTIKEWQDYETILNNQTEGQKIINPIDKMYFVTSQNDIESWSKIFAKAGNWPAGILLYSDNDGIEKHNFASKEVGDQENMTNFLQKAINNQNDNYIDYEKQILGFEITDDKRTGYVNQVLKESLINESKKITVKDNELKII